MKRKNPTAYRTYHMLKHSRHLRKVFGLPRYTGFGRTLKKLRKLADKFHEGVPLK